jgi:hypothetical protein
MGSRPQAEQGGNGSVESEPTATDAIERQLQDALDSADATQTRYHLRQALQLVHALEE